MQETGTDDTGMLQALECADDAIEAANRAVDVESLERLISEDFVYTGGQGGHISRGQWIAAQSLKRLTEEGKAQASMAMARAEASSRGTVQLMTGLRVGDAAEREIELHADVAIVNRVYSIMEADGVERCLRYVRVYRWQSDDWQLISHRYIHAVD